MATILETSRQTATSLSLPVSEEREYRRMAQQLRRNPYIRIKTSLEFWLAVLLMVLSAPIILFCALLIKLTSRGPALYSQTRLGLRGRPYRIWKLRTMYHQCERHSGPQWSQAGDPRVTPLGRLLRASHLDELPQLWNILRGEMSLIGPRPERPEFIPTLARAIPLYEARMLVRPGVTGLAQVQLPPDTDLDSVRAKLAHDLYYIRNADAWMDLRIVLATALKVFGAPFAFLRSFFYMPAAVVVERHYQTMQLASAVPVPAVQLEAGLATQS